MTGTVTYYQYVFQAFRAFAFIFLLLVLFTVGAECQEKDDYDEISMVLNVQRIGTLELPVIVHGQIAYLPVTKVFDFLKIRNRPSLQMDSVEGYIINPDAAFLIDKVNNRILYQKKVFVLKPDDLIHTETNLYLSCNYFGQVFGLLCLFDFRNLSITLSTKLELPAMAEMKREQMRQNIRFLIGEKKADTTIGRDYPVFKFGMADWSVIARQQAEGSSDVNLHMELGGIIAGGEANLALNYNSAEPLGFDHQFYHWRFVKNNNPVIRQVMVGKFIPHATSYMNAPALGMQISNTPTSYRRSFGTYRLSDITEPGWLVELYVNDVLVNYMKADASGLYTFDVPLVYGNSVIRLQFYGLWGEERTREKNISIPFNFLPLHELEYGLSAGIIQDDQNSRFSRINIDYGLGRHFTLGGGMEYLSSVASGKSMPFLNSSLQLGSGLLVSGEYTHGVRSQGTISCRLPHNLEVDLNYVRYNRGQTAIPFNYLEERKAIVSMPFYGRKFSAFSRLAISQIILPKAKNTSLEFVFSSIVARVSSSFTTYALLNDQVHPTIYSDLSFTFRLPAGFIATPRIQYLYSKNMLGTIKSQVEKSLFHKGFINLSYEKDFVNNTPSFSLGLRFDFSFAQTTISVQKSKKAATFVQSASGSMMYQEKTNYFAVSNRKNAGKGGLIIFPFLDLNCNGKRETDEPKVAGLNLHINEGRITRSNGDTAIVVSGLEAYASCFIELDRNSFDNIAWQIRKATFSVVIDPNRIKIIEVPVSVMGEVSGTVYLNGVGKQKGQGRIIVCIYNNESKQVTRTLTEEDGFFSFLGLSPGSYTADIDIEQLHKLRMTSSPPLPFAILPKQEGDVIGGLEFRLHPIKNNIHGQSVNSRNN